MITLFAMPKAFAGRVGVIQRNALASWCVLDGVRVVLIGSEPGIAEAAADAGAAHVPDVALNEHGTPLLDNAFERVGAISEDGIWCLVNADIVLLDDFLPAVHHVRTAAPRFLMVGATIDVDLTDRLALDDPAVRADLRQRALSDGRSRGATAIDYFVFTAGLFDPVPPFVVGRARFDNWLVWRGRERGIVVDASATVVAVHQRHDYAHVPGGLQEAHFGEEAGRNLELAGGKRHLYTIHDASHRLAPDGRLTRNLGATARVRENVRKISWKLSPR